ncbi:helix-turn-helix domain-containing protein [Streptomyces phyllanthi]|uniref:Helix-turn-helix domain-containing protein n=1 Tax=Streptomyces phyllanthi TaxID=1803180 RepID=A0A5N8VVM6_9ACTN|nr:helix-turn-helix domain-containing protein [Streptomyces phyllanthi]MPY38832.1 helix-turn-helix domain-containing protein [Streptomyces phyllanthi]
MTVLVSTADVSVREREEAWREAVAQVFVPLDFTFSDPSTFRGEISADVLGSVAVCRVTAGPHRALRTERQIARTEEMPYYKVSMPLRGYVLVSQDGREAPLLPGDLALYDTSRPYEVSFDDTCRLLVLMFPHRELRLGYDAVSRLTARRVSGRTGIGALVVPLLVNLAARLDEIGGAQSARLADNVIDLLSTLYADLLTVAGHRPSDPRRTLMAKMRCFIEDRLDDPDLDPETVAAACHISVGYLHKLFRAEGTSVSRVIRERRLEQCRRDLVAPASRDKAVSAIGAHWGFLDAAHFSRVFKATYGVSPREYRLSRDPSGTVEMAATAADPGV